VLKQRGDNLTRENVMKQAANLKKLELGMLLPGPISADLRGAQNRQLSEALETAGRTGAIAVFDPS